MIPQWLAFLRKCEAFEEFKKDIPYSFWRLSMTDTVGVCVGHWWDGSNDGMWVVLLFEDGSLSRFGPFSLFPAPEPPWWDSVKPNEIEIPGEKVSSNSLEIPL